MKFRLLPIVLLSTLALVGCGGGDVPPEDHGKEVILPEEHENAKYTFTVNNLAEMQAGWPQGAEKEFDLSVFVDGVEGNALLEQAAGNLELIANHTKALTVTGFKVTANQLGTWKVAVRYYDTVKHYSFEISDKLPEPAIEKSMTISQVLEDVENHDMDKMYEVEGLVKDWHSKDAWNKYGEFDLADPADNEKSLYFYGTRVSDKYISWDGTAGKYVYSSADAPYDVLENDMTKNLKKGDTAKLRVVYTAQYKNFYGMFVSVTAGAVIEATSVSLNKKTLELVEGASETLVATVEPANCNQEAQWTSSKPDIATVDSTGKVVGKAEGTATITVTVGAKTDTCEVTVSKDVSTNITLTVDTLGVASGAYGDSSAAVAVKGVNWEWKEIGNYGDGLQWRTKNGKTSTLWNSSATSSAIANIVVSRKEGKYSDQAADQCLKVEFANNADFTNAQELTVSFAENVLDATLTPNAGMTYVRISHNAPTYTNSMYIPSIVVNF